MSEPFIAIGNDELGGALGDTITCPTCGGEHVIEQSGPSKYLQSDGTWGVGPAGLMQFYKCGEDTYVAGIGGKRLR
ncbi:MAG: hypothetical protein RL156_1747 [Bacteroidota bacterium]|jgi:hypothetical protein